MLIVDSAVVIVEVISGAVPVDGSAVAVTSVNVELEVAEVVDSV